MAVHNPESHTCPKCRRTNFTAAGLVRHKCRPPGPGEPVNPAAVALAPAVVESTCTEVLDPHVEVGLVLPPLPPALVPIFDGIRDVEAFVAGKINRVQRYLHEQETDIAYDKVEIGWWLLRGKAAAGHGMAGQRNAAKIESETVSDSISPAGFLGLVTAVFPEIQERTARNLMNAARNLGLTAESPLTAVHALRTAKALGHRRLKDLYRPPAGELEDSGGEGGMSFEQLRAQSEITSFQESIRRLNSLGLEKRVFLSLPPAQLRQIDGTLLELRRAIAETLHGGSR